MQIRGGTDLSNEHAYFVKTNLRHVDADGLSGQTEALQHGIHLATDVKWNSVCAAGAIGLTLPNMVNVGWYVFRPRSVVGAPSEHM